MLKAANNQLPGFECQNHQEWEEPFFFLQAADSQIGLMVQVAETKEGETYFMKPKLPISEITWDEEIKIIRTLVQEVNAMEPKPAFVVMCGDMVDAYPMMGIDGVKKEQDADFKKAFEDLRVPLVCVCGNHDIGNNPTPESVNDYRQSYGDDHFAFLRGGGFTSLSSTLSSTGNAAKCKTWPGNKTNGWKPSLPSQRSTSWCSNTSPGSFTPQRNPIQIGPSTSPPGRICSRNLPKLE